MNCFVTSACKEVGGRMVKELDFDSGKELSKEEAQKKPAFEIHKMFVDPKEKCV